MTIIKNTSDIYYIGADDHKLDLFENQYKIPNGISYNSYLIRDKKCVVMDTADARVTETWFKNLEEALEGRTPDYLTVLHMEPDHSANVANFLERYPDSKLIVNAKTLSLLQQFFGKDFSERAEIVKEGDVFDTGSHKLKFIFAPMVHWPEVMVAFDETDGILFSADAFGTFGCLNGDCHTVAPDWDEEAARYYLNIVGKYGGPVAALLKKCAALDIKTIAPLHGPVLTEDLSRYLDFYTKWSSYTPDKKGTLICHASLHGNTAKAALEFAKTLNEKGEDTVVIDLMRDDTAAAVALAFRYEKLALFSSTYEGDVVPAMNDFLYRLKLKGCRGKKVGIIENATWAPAAAKKIGESLEQMQGMQIIEPQISIRTNLTPETRQALTNLAEKLTE